MRTTTSNSATEEPVIFLSDFFSELKNSIDYEVQKLLIDLNSKSLDLSNNSKDFLFKHHDDVINEVTKLEQKCFSSLKTLARDSFDENWKKEVFANQTIIFLNRSIFEKIRGFKCEDWFFGKLIVIDDEHFDERIIQIIKRLELLQSNKITGNEYLKVTFFLSQLKSMFLGDGTILHINLDLANQHTANLKDSSLQKLCIDTFKDFSQLKSVDISFNRFDHVDGGMFKELANLEELDISRNQLLTELPLFYTLTSLTKLSLSFLQISVVPANVFKSLVNLKCIDLSNNYGLKIIEKDVFGGLQMLTEIDLSSCALTSIDKHLFKGLTRLTNLNLDGNELTSFSSSIFNDLLNLSSLTLSSNLLTELPTDLLSHLTRLTRINLSNNSLKFLDAHFFKGAFNLTYINLSDNKLSKLNENLFKGLVNLELVDFSYNSIRKLPAKCFSDLNRLKTLRLNDNKLKTIDTGTFSGLVNLEEIDISSNDLKGLDSSVFDNLAKINLINLFSNQFEFEMSDEYFNLGNNVHFNWNKTYCN